MVVLFGNRSTRELACSPFRGALVNIGPNQPVALFLDKIFQRMMKWCRR